MLCEGTMKQTTVLQSWPRLDHEAAQKTAVQVLTLKALDCAVHGKTHI